MIKKIFWKIFGAGVLIVICILAVTVLTSEPVRANGENEIVLNFSFQTPEISEINVSGTTYHLVTMNQTQCMGNTNVPYLPIKPLKILLPQNGTLEYINVTLEENTSLQDEYNVILGPYYGSFNNTENNESDELNYNTSKPYPTEAYSNPSIHFFRGYKILVFNLYPLYYLNNTAEIYYYKNVSVTIKTNNTASVDPFIRGLQSDETMMKQKVDDYSMNYTYTYIPDPPSNSSIINGSQNYDYLIITETDLWNEPPPSNWDREWKTFKDFAKSKTENGTNTIIKNVSEIESCEDYWVNGTWGDNNPNNPFYISGIPDSYCYIFNDTQAKIRNCIRDLYFNCGVEYVLLGGDNDTVPSRFMYPSIPSDLYYACLDGSYNGDNKKSRWGDHDDGDYNPDEDEVEPGGGGTFYASADSKNSLDSFNVSLFTPAMDFSDLPEEDVVTISFEKNFKSANLGDYINVSVYSGGKIIWDYEENLIADNETGDSEDYGSTFTGTFNPYYDYNNDSEVYIQFHYNYVYNGEEAGSFNIDDVNITIPGEIDWEQVLWESFENSSFLPDGWKIKKYGTAKGSWTRKPYVDDLDLIAEVYVGRACVETPKEVSNFVIKTLAYESSKANDDYISKALLVGVNLSIHHVPGDQMQTTAMEYKEETRNYNDSWGYQTYGIPEGIESGEYLIDTLYDADWQHNSSIRPLYRIFGWPHSELKNRIDEGRSIINMMGHGGYKAIGRPWSPKNYYHYNENPKSWRDLPVLNWLQAYMLSNDKYFFMYAISCWPGRFTDPGKKRIPDDCLAEFLTIKTNHGAFAVIMYSTSGDLQQYSTNSATQRYDREFFDAIYRENIYQLGKALQDSKEDNLNWIKETERVGPHPYDAPRRAYYMINLFGDPQISIKMPVKDNSPAVPETPQKYSNILNWHTFNSSTTDSEGDKVSYQWKWGEDENQRSDWTQYYNSGVTVYWTKWLPSGSHNIRVRSRDISCLSESNWSDPLPITVQFNTNMDIFSSPVVLGEETQFYGQSIGGANPIQSWNYTLGDGNYSDQKNTNHTYGAVGAYNVTLYVSDNNSVTSNVTKVVKIVILKSDINSSSNSGIPNETVSFNDLSEGYYEITNWYWDFGDGNTSNNRNTSHAYESEGVYNVSLNVTDAESNYNVSYQTIYIDSGDPEITSFSSDLDTVGYGYNVTITTNLSDNVSGIKNATVNITYPDYSYCNFSMNNTYSSTYEYVFKDSCQLGDYTYVVWTVDNAGNLDNSSSKSFTVVRSFGCRLVGSSNQSLWDTITGSRFKVNLKGVADNVSVYIDPGNATSDSHYQCMIYRHNDSKLMGISEQKNVTSGKGWQLFNFSVPKPVLINDTEYVLGCWSDNYTVKMYYSDGNEEEMFYDDGSSTLQGHYFEGVYNYTPDINNFRHEDRRYSIYCRYTPDNTTPEITNVSNTPDTVGFGFNITITADVTDNASGVATVKVNVTYPDESTDNFTMNHTGNNTYKYVFSATWIDSQNAYTWLVGQYNYTVWAVDYAGNSASSSGYSFNVSAQATLSIATLKNSYGANEYINITDPPLPPDDYYLVGRGLSWNEYYNASSGKNIREIYTNPVNYQDETGGWTPIERNISLIDNNHPAYGYGYRAGNDNGLYNVYFKPNAQDGWPVAFAYDKSTDPEAYVVRSKLAGVGYLDPSSDWTYEYLQSVQSSQGQLTGNSAIYENVFTGTNVVWTYDNTGLKEEIIMSNLTKELLQDHPPSEYGLSNQDSYLVFITKLDYQNLQMYNSSGVLSDNFTTTDEQIDFKDALGYLKCAMPVGEAYELQDESVRHRLTYRVLQYNGNYYLLSGLKVADLNDMTFPVVIDPTLTVGTSSSDGDMMKDDISYSNAQGAADGIPRGVDTTFTIGQQCDSAGPPPARYLIWRGFVYFDTSSIPSNDLIDTVTLKLYKDADFSVTDFDIIIQNGQPTYPHSSLVPGDYDKSHYSGNAGSLNTASFSSGYNDITMTNHSWIDTNGTTKLCLRSSRDINSNTPSGNEYVTICSYEYPQAYGPKLVVEYRNQSKIKNTGSTNISGYLFMQIQNYNTTSSSWVCANVVINETTPRIINSSEQLALDLIFNGLVNTNDLSNEDGTYRVYAAFRDPDGNILKCDDDTEMVSWYEFEVNY